MKWNDPDRLNAIKDACNANIYINGQEKKANSVLPDIVVSLGKVIEIRG